MGIIVPRANRLSVAPALFVLVGIPLTRLPRVAQFHKGSPQPNRIDRLSQRINVKMHRIVPSLVATGTLTRVPGKSKDERSGALRPGATVPTCKHPPRNPPVEN